MSNSISVVIPAKNEAQGLSRLLPSLRDIDGISEILVINDGSTDGTGAVATENGCICITHPYSMGNGAAVKTGARAAKGDILVFMDADGQHDPSYIPELMTTLTKGYDMVVGARDSNSQASMGRLTANAIYNLLASFITGQRVRDLTSGFRVVNANKFRRFLSLLPNGFSYPTTITMAFFRSGFPVAYIPIQAPPRLGKSHIQPLKDGVRFLMVIFKVGTLYSPLKIFFPISLAFFITGLFYYGYTLLTAGRFTNMSALLFSTSVIIFLIGLVSEQITALMYKET